MRALVFALLAGVTLATPASAAVRVGYADPSGFTDADRAGGLMTADGAARSLAGHLERLGGRLPSGRDLRVEILDIDLAGRIAPERDPTASRRFLDGSTWPRIRLRYTLTERGPVVASDEELVSWQDYLQRVTARYAGDPLRYEKAMLADWFEQRILSRAARASR